MLVFKSATLVAIRTKLGDQRLCSTVDVRERKLLVRKMARLG
jgi:hypothetical protein